MRWSVVVFLVAAAACAVAHAAILASVIRRRAGVIDSSVPRPRAAVEVLWALVPAIALAVVLTATWNHVREGSANRPVEVMKVAR